MFTVKITNVEKVPHIETDSVMLEVSFDVLKDGTLVESRKQGFSSNYSEDQIVAALQDVARDYQHREDKAAADAAEAEKNAAVDSTMNALMGKEINAGE